MNPEHRITSEQSATTTASFRGSAMRTVALNEVNEALAEILADFSEHFGHVSFTMDVAWHRKGQKLITIKAGKEFRFLIKTAGEQAGK